MTDNGKSKCGFFPFGFAQGLNDKLRRLACDLQKRAVLAGFLRGNEPYFGQNREKPEKTCGNRRNTVDKERGKAEGELRYGSPHPHEH
jgi:hypothetical protein